MASTARSRTRYAGATRAPPTSGLNPWRAAGLVLRIGGFLVWLLLARAIGPHPGDRATGVRLRRLLKSSGVTPIKIGQYLALRLDLLPAEVCDELSQLFASVAPLPFAQVKRVVETELGAPLEALFSAFDPVPIGSASIAQVHQARDHAGRELAVKVQRPGVADLLRSDFRLLRSLARLTDRLGMWGPIITADLIDEIATFTMREIDFLQEGRTADHLRKQAGERVHIPWVAWELTTARVLTMELIHGTPLTRIVVGNGTDADAAFAKVAPGVPPSAILDALASAFLYQLFVSGIFHGDPHPANVLIERDGTVALVDFGIFGELAFEDRRVLASYVRHLAFGRIADAYADYVTLVEPTAETDMPAFRHDTLAILADWHRSATDPHIPAGERLTARFQGLMFEQVRRHGVRMRYDLLLFWRALAVLDATAHRLPSDFNLLATIRTFFAARQVASFGTTLASLASELEPAAVYYRIDGYRKALRRGRALHLRRFTAETTRAQRERRSGAREAKSAALAIMAAGAGGAVAGLAPTELAVAAVLTTTSVVLLFAACRLPGSS